MQQLLGGLVDSLLCFITASLLHTCSPHLLPNYLTALLPHCREKALLFLWDRQRLELHGVFRPDAAAKALPEASLPGGGADGRSQVREDGCS